MEILRNILIGIQYLHGKNIAHCDLKTTTILVHTDNIKIIEFSRASDDAIKLSRFFLVKKERSESRHLAPEMTDGLFYKTAVDMYSFGIIMSELKKNPDFLDPSSFTEKGMNSYWSLMVLCLKEKSTEKITASDALKIPLFRALLPSFYRFSHLQNFNIESKNMKATKIDSLFINYIIDGRLKKMEIQETQPLESSTDTLIEETAENFLIFIDGKETRIHAMLNEDIAYLRGFLWFMKTFIDDKKYFHKSTLVKHEQMINPPE